MNETNIMPHDCSDSLIPRTEDKVSDFPYICSYCGKVYYFSSKRKKGD